MVEEIIEKVINYGKRFGNVELNYIRRKFTSLVYRNKKYHSSSQREYSTLSIRIVDGKKFGTAVVHPENWKKGIEMAVKNMKINSKLKYTIGLPSKKIGKVKAFSEKSLLSIKEMDEMIHTLLSEKYFNIESEIETSFYERIYANEETMKKSKNTEFSALVVLKNKDTQVEYGNADYKPFNLEKIREIAEEKAEKFANKQKFESKIVDAVFTPEAGYQLIKKLLNAFSGELILKKRSYLVDKYRKKVFSNNLTIKSVPNKKMLSAYPFDSEGNPSEEKYLVKNGKVTDFLLDRYCANALKMKKPMHSNSLIDIPSTNHIGPYEVESGKSKVDGELIIDELMGWHTIDAISGNASLSIVNGLMNGKSIKDGMIAFNIFDAFKEVELGRKKEKVYNLILPKMKFKVQFIG